jgi:hypothetical protein
MNRRKLGGSTKWCGKTANAAFPLRIKVTASVRFASPRPTAVEFNIGRMGGETSFVQRG